MQTLKLDPANADSLEIDPKNLSHLLAPLRAGERLRLLYEQLGDRLVASTSFGLQAAVMLHLMSTPLKSQWFLSILGFYFLKPISTSSS
jgi:3'-phosphoadenosine 5'-phosphosulfate sulfotransferase (PAPS reductase)/FAD synthetase